MNQEILTKHLNTVDFSQVPDDECEVVCQEKDRLVALIDNIGEGESEANESWTIADLRAELARIGG